MSYIVLDLGLKVFIKFNLTADFRAACTVPGESGLRNWCAATTMCGLKRFWSRGARAVLIRAAGAAFR